MTCLNTQSSSLFHMHPPYHLLQMPWTLPRDSISALKSKIHTPSFRKLSFSYNCPTPNLARLALNSTGLELQTTLPCLWTRMTGVCHVVGRTLKIFKASVHLPLLTLPAAGDEHEALQPCWKGALTFSVLVRNHYRCHIFQRLHWHKVLSTFSDQ